MKYNYRYFVLSGLILTACSTPQSAPKTDKSKPHKILRVVQLGDSHTAGDYFTEELRQQLQKKFGNGGIGLVLPHSIKGQRSATISYDGKGWQVSSSRTETGDFPLGGVIARTANGQLTLSAKNPNHQIQQITITLKPHKTSSRLEIVSQGKKQTISGLNVGKWQTVKINANLPLTLNAKGLLDLGLIQIENNHSGGATVSALGINGAQLSHTQKWRTDWFSDIKQSRADVVILAYGTNEAFNDTLELEQTEQTWRNTIRKIRQQLPKAKIVLLGAPETLRSTQGNCGVRPAMLDVVQSMQQRLATQEKILFWSWEKAMGGRCSMKKWINQGLASKDGVHFSAAGYKTVAARFASDMLKWLK